MSLDVYLTIEAPTILPKSGSGIFVRRNGSNIEITREEWEKASPGQEPVVFNNDGDSGREVYSDNITHNLNKMADAAGIYQHLWRPEEISITKAAQLIEPLVEGARKLRADPQHFKALNPSNGWGDYDGLCRFVEAYLNACREYPEANVGVSR